MTVKALFYVGYVWKQLMCVCFCVQALSHKLQTPSNDLKREQGEQGFIDHYLLFSIWHDISSESCPNPIQTG